MKSKSYHHLFLMLLALIVLAGCASGSGRLFNVPQKPAPSKHYLFYLHEANLEDLSPDNKHVKNYEKMVSLWTQQGFLVFSEHRDIVLVEVYARKISDQIQQLLKRGVPAGNISVVGYSKGSLIAQSVAEQMNNPNINYVLLAGCSDSRPITNSHLQGRVLSIIDSNDQVFHSCKSKLSRPHNGLKFKEIRVNSGLGHNLFRVPRQKFTKLWQTPMKEWLVITAGAVN